jgi:hypothetical protein
MIDRRWLWIGACLLLAGLVFWGVGEGVGPSSGETEFRKTQEAMKQIKSFRGTYADSGSSMGHSERQWEVDCNRVIVYERPHNSQTGTDSSFDMRGDEMLVGDQRYMLEGNGSWENTGYAGDRSNAKWYCNRIAEGTDSGLLPDMFSLVNHGITEKSDKKTVNGVRCREWKFDIRTPVSSRKGAICLGVDDHLPYEMTLDGGHYFYSDFNQPIPIEVPDATLQSSRSSRSSN